MRIKNSISLFILNFSFIYDVICQKTSDKPLVLLISFDGFRWDYLTRHTLENFNYLKSIGSHADFIYNSFATVTFPNHWSIVTGLHEESHGIIQNEMYDSVLNKTFYYNHLDSLSYEWFGQNKFAEPIWITNQRGDGKRRSAAEWIGSNVAFGNQTVFNIPYDHLKPYNELIDKFTSLFVNESDPINFGALYFDEPDYTGHLFGPESEEMKSKLQELDKTLNYLIAQLKKNNLFDKINLIITSDHGMQTISSKDKAIFIDEYVDTNLFRAYGSSVVYDLFLKNMTNLQEVYDKLKKVKNIDVFKKEDIPEKFNYKNNVRTGDLLLISHLGYVMFLNKSQNINWTLIHGTHGYYNNETSMFPIFIAQGPAFKKNFKVESFKNVDIYPLMCSILKVTPALNNGTLDIVKMMLIQNSKLTDTYAILSIIPIFCATLSAIILCVINKRTKLPGQSNIPNDGYMMVSTSDTNVLLNDDEDTNVI